MQEVAGGFIVKKNKFLFGKRSKKKNWAAGTWDIVGGHALKGELPLETLKRETYEETCITVLHAKLLTTIDVPEENSDSYFRYYIYMVTSWKGKAVNASHEHTQMQWLTKKQLAKRKLAMALYLELIAEWLGE